MKSLDKWDDTSVTLNTQYMFSKGENTYRFPERVLRPECSQQDVWDTVLPPHVLNEFTETGGRNVFLLTYGQTGTGKTHTIFGPKEFLQPGCEGAADWGLFPKAVHHTIERMRAKGGSCRWKLYISAVEFYFFSGFDLLDNKKAVSVNASTGHASLHMVEIEKIEDLMPLLETISSNRTSASTAMNKSSKRHDGSSRSHAFLKLTLFQTHDNQFQKSEFTLADMAGAERPEKAGGTRVSWYESYCAMKAGQPLQPGDTALVINGELSGVLSIIVSATDAAAKGISF